MEFVIIDLETSGLDAREDAIIEVALLRVNLAGKVLAEWGSLVNPGFVIPEEITHLTSITPEQLEHAPDIRTIRQTIQEFIGRSPIIGHNVSFDIGFLIQNGITIENELIVDTFKLAEFLHFDKKSLNLTSLTEELGYIHLNAHRASADVIATHFLFQHECEQIRNLDSKQRDSIASISARSSHAVLPFLYQLTRGMRDEDENISSTVPLESRKLASEIFPFVNPGARFSEAAISKAFVEWLENTPEKLDKKPPKIKIPSAADILKQAKIEDRPEQKRMMDEIEGIFANRGHLCIEAPTGIGKTFAYLIPAVSHALRTEKQVFISTNTKTLQDQIEKKDILQVQEYFRASTGMEFTFQKLKGRQNYLSILKFFEYFDQQGFDYEASIFALKLSFWLCETESGELDELSLYGIEFLLLDEVHAGDMRVLSPENPYKDQEFVLKARNGAKTAHIVILNHALILSEYLEDTETWLLPKIETLILDEVHNLESVATETLKETTEFVMFEKTLADIERTIKKFNKAKPIEAFVTPEIPRLVEGILLNSALLFEGIEKYFRWIQNTKNTGYGGGRSYDILIESDFFETDIFRESVQLYSSLSDKINELEKIFFAAPKLLMFELGRHMDRLSRYEEHIRKYLYVRDESLIRMLAKKEGGGMRIVTTPLAIGPILQEKIWDITPSVVIMSATLSIHQSFAYITRILSLESFQFERLKTDFDYSKQALLYIPAELWDVRNNHEKRAIEIFLRDILTIFRGRTLMLFTSFAAIRETTLSLAPDMKRAGIQLLTQGMSGGKHKLVGEFKKHANSSVLLGTDSFWEGVDFPGEMLELLIIHKLPFSVPTDPVFVARGRLFQDSFREYALPMMILKLRQGIGRLIRTKSDKGIIVLLDKRVTTDWGSEILASLPEWMPVKMSNTESFLKLLSESRGKFAHK